MARIMLQIGAIHFDDEIPGKKFACDLSRCKGACCTSEGGRGAPVTDDEVDEIDRALSVVREIIPPGHREIVDKYGWREGAAGDIHTICIDRSACVFVYYKNTIALCSFEKAYEEKKIGWQKPLSCHLFPLRRSRVANQSYLRFEFFDHCACALDRGEHENIRLFIFLHSALIRAFGKDWYGQILKQFTQITST